MDHGRSRSKVHLLLAKTKMVSVIEQGRQPEGISTKRQAKEECTTQRSHHMTFSSQKALALNLNTRSESEASEFVSRTEAARNKSVS